MSPTVLRWSALPLGLLAFVLNVTMTVWVTRFSFTPGLLIVAGACLVVVGVPFGVFMLLAGGDRRRPAAFIADGGALTVAPSPVYAGSQVILWMGLSGNLVAAEWWPGRDAMRLSQRDTGSFYVVGTIWVAALIFLLVQRPRLRLDPTGLTIRKVRRTTHLAWADLRAGGPPPPARRRQRYLRVYLAGPPVIDGYPPSEDIPIAWLHIDPAFLAERIRHYVETPEDRATIGAMAATASANAV